MMTNTSLFKKNHIALLIILIITIISLINNVNTVSIGSCAKLSLDGLKCQQCINNYHLNDGQCYVDILGCQKYTFGNICRKCQNGYILVNNLCCDQRCMAQIMRVQKASQNGNSQGKIVKNVTQIISDHFQTLSVIIPHLQQIYIQESAANLIQIDYQSFIDVDRYVFLYEFYSGGFSRKRAIVDYVKKSSNNETLNNTTLKKQIIDVDWKTLTDNQEFLSFPKQELAKQDYSSQFENFARAFQSNSNENKNSQQKVILMKRYQFSNINEYQIATENSQTRKATIKTLYKTKEGQILLLINQEKDIPKFQPYQFRYQGQQSIKSKAEQSPALKKVLEFVSKDPRYHPELQVVVEKATTKQVTHFIVFISNEKQTVEFFIDHSNLNHQQQCKIIDVLITLKEVLPTIKQPEALPVKENQIDVELDKVPQKIIDQIEKIHQDQDAQSEKSCEQENKSEKDQLISLIKQKFSNYKESSQFVETFRRQFDTFDEITVLLKVNSNDNTEKYQYFFIKKMSLSGQFIFEGVQQRQKPTIKQNKHVVCNQQKTVKNTQLVQNTNIITFLNDQYPQTIDQNVILAKVREFPNKKRYIIIFRFQTQERRYIVQLSQKDSSLTCIQWSTLQKNLQRVSKGDHKPAQVCEIIDTVIEQIQEENDQLCDHQQNDSHAQIEEQKQKDQLNFLKIIRAKYQDINSSSDIKILRHWVTKFRLVREITLLVQYQNKDNNNKYAYFFFSKDSRGQHFHGRIDVTTQSPSVNKRGQYTLPNPQKIYKSTDQLSLNAVAKVNQEHPITAHQSTIIQQVLIRQFPDHNRVLVILETAQNGSQYWVNDYLQNNNNNLLEKVVIVDFIQKHQHLIQEQKQIDQEKVVPQIAEQIRKQLDSGDQVIESPLLPAQDKLNILNFIRENNQDISSSAKIVKVIQSWHSQNLIEKTALIQDPQKNQFKYCYLNQNTKSKTLQYLGCENTNQFKQNTDTQEYILPNPQKKIQAEQYQFILQKIYQRNPQSKGKPFINLEERKFPLISRIIVVIRLKNTIIRYIIQINLKNSQVKIVSQEIIEENLKELSQGQSQAWKLKEQIQSVVLKQKQEQDQANNIHIQIDQESLQKLDEQRQKEFKSKIVNFIRNQRENIEDFQILRIWRRKSFKNFQQITVLIKYKDTADNNKYKYEYFFIGLQLSQPEKFVLLGSQPSESPQTIKDNSQLYALPNPQRLVSQQNQDIQKYIKMINNDHPQTINLPIVKILKRVFGKTTTRIIIIYRYEQMTVQYVLIKTIQSTPEQNQSYDIKIIQSQPFEINLPICQTKQDKQEIKHQQELQVAVQQKLQKQEHKKFIQQQIKQIEEQQKNINQSEIQKQNVDVQEIKEKVLNKQYQKLINIIEKNQKDLVNSQIVLVWNKKFDTFEEQIGIIQKGNQYYKVYISEKSLPNSSQESSNTVDYLGSQKINQPKRNSEGQIQTSIYQSQDQSKEIQQSQPIEKYIKFLNQQRPQTINQKIMTTVIRDFPRAIRVRIVVRFQTSRNIYILKEYKSTGKIVLMEEKVLKEDLPEIKPIDNIQTDIQVTVPQLKKQIKDQKEVSQIVHKVVSQIQHQKKNENQENTEQKPQEKSETKHEIVTQQIVKKIIDDLQQDKKQQNITPEQKQIQDCIIQEQDKPLIVIDDPKTIDKQLIQKQQRQKQQKQQKENNQQSKEQIKPTTADNSVDSELISFIKENDQILSQLNKDSYQVPMIFRRKFDSFKQITVLIKINQPNNEPSYIYYFIKRNLQSNQLVYQGKQQKSQPTVLNGQLAIPNPQQSFTKDNPNYNKIITYLNQHKTQTKNRSIIISKVREFPQHRRYLFVIRLITQEKRYILEQNTQQIRIIQEKILQQKLSQLQIDNKDQEKVATIIQQVLSQIKQESLSQGCIGDNQQLSIIQKQEQQLIKLIRQNNQDLDQFKILKRWKNSHLRPFNEITLLIQVQNARQQELNNYQYFYAFFMESKKDHIIQYSGKTRVVEPLLNSNGDYILPNQQARIKQQQATKAIEIIHKEHSITNPQENLSSSSLAPTITKIIMREFPQHKRYIIEIQNNKLFMRFIVLENKLNQDAPKIVDFEETQKDSFVETNVVSSTQQKQKEIQQKKQALDEIAIQINNDHKTTIASQTKIPQVTTIQEVSNQIQNKKILGQKLFNFIKEQYPSFISNNALVIKVWQREPYRTYQQVTLLIQDGDKYIYYFIMKPLIENQSFKNWGKITKDKLLQNPNTNQLILPNPQQLLQRDNFPDKVITLINEKFDQTKQKRVNTIWKRIFPEYIRYQVRIRTQTQIVQYIVNQKESTQELTILPQERFVIQDKLNPLTQTQIAIGQIQNHVEKQIINQVKAQKQIIPVSPVVIIQQRAIQQQNKTNTENSNTNSNEKQNPLIEQKLLNVIRQNNPKLQTLEVVQVWRRKPFVKSRQITVLMKDTSNNQYYYFYIRKILETNEFIYLGSQNKEAPYKIQHQDQSASLQSQEEELELPNSQKNVQKEAAQDYIDLLYLEKPQTKNQQVTKILEKTFPDGSQRVIIRIRQQTRIIQYVLLKDSHGVLTLDQFSDYKTDLKPLTGQQQQNILIIQKIQANIDSPENKVQIKKNIEISANQNLNLNDKSQNKQAVIQKWKIIQQKSSLSQGVKTILTQTLDKPSQGYLQYAISHLQSTQYAIPTEKKPVKIFRNTFCNQQQSVLVFRYSPSSLTYLMFVQKLDIDKIDFMGMQTIEIDPSMTNSQIIDITQIKVDIKNSQRVKQAVQLITSKYQRMINRQVRQVNARKFSNQERFSLLFKDQFSKEINIDDRFLVIFKNGDGSSSNQVISSVVEECRIKSQQVDYLKSKENEIANITQQKQQKKQQNKVNSSETTSPTIIVQPTQIQEIVKDVIQIKKQQQEKILPNLEQKINKNQQDLKTIQEQQKKSEQQKTILQKQLPQVKQEIKQQNKEIILQQVIQIKQKIDQQIQKEQQKVDIKYQNLVQKKQQQIKELQNQKNQLLGQKNKQEQIKQNQIENQQQKQKLIADQLQKKREEKQRQLKIVQEQTKKHVGQTNTQIITENNQGSGEINVIVKEVQQTSQEINSFNAFLAQVAPQSTTQPTVGIQQQITQIGKTILISKKRTQGIESIDQYFIYKNLKTNDLYYLGKKNIDTQSFNPVVSTLQPQTQLLSQNTDKPTIIQTTLQISKKLNGQTFAEDQINRITYQKYPNGLKWTIYFQFSDDTKYAIAEVLKDYSDKYILLNYIQKQTEIIKKHLTIQSQESSLSVLNKLKDQICSLQNVLSQVYTNYPQLQSMKLIKQVRSELPHQIQFQLKFQGQQSSTIENKQESLVVLCGSQSIQSTQVKIQITSYIKSQSKSQQQQNTISQIVKQVQQQQIIKYSPVDPNVVYYPAASKLLQSLPKDSQLSENIKLDQISDQLRQIIYYLRIRYDIIRISSVIKIIRNNISSINNRQSYRIYFFLSPDQNHKYYRVYQAQIIYTGADLNQNKIKVNSFNLIIDQNKLIQKIVSQKEQEDVDIAYGYKNMDIVQIKHNSDVKIIMKQIEQRYGQLLKGSLSSSQTQIEIISVQYLQLKDNRINYKIILGNQNKQKFKFVVFYQPNIQRVLVLNSINGYKNQTTQQLSNQQQTKDLILQKIVQNYLPQLHKQELGYTQQSISNTRVYHVTCVGIIQNTQGIDYYINIINQNTGKKFRSIVRVSKQNSNDFKEISWTQVVQISLDHYRLDQSQRIFITSFQKLTQQQIKNNGNFKLVYNYAKHQNQDLAAASLLGAASKPSNIGFQYQIFARQSNGNLMKAIVYLQSYSQKIKLVSVESLNFVDGFIDLKTDDIETNQIATALKKKTNLDSLENQNQGDYLVKSAQAKAFLYGNLYKMQIQISLNENMGGQKSVFQGLLYHDHSTQQLHLIYWKQIQSGNTGKCLQQDPSNQCTKCLNNAPIVNNQCTLGVQNCEFYNGLTCATCKQGSLMINGVCSNDCGPLCDIVVLR